MKIIEKLIGEIAVSLVATALMDTFCESDQGKALVDRIARMLGKREKARSTFFTVEEVDGQLILVEG